MSGPNPRAAAVAALVRQEQDGFSNLILDAELRRQKLEGRDKAFASAIFYTVLEHQGTLDYILSQFLPKGLAKLDPQVREILRAALAQARYMQVPASAAGNEAVKLTRTFKKASASGLVNAVLRRAIGYDLGSAVFADEVERLMVLGSAGRDVAAFLHEHYPDEALDILTMLAQEHREQTKRLWWQLIPRGVLCELALDKPGYFLKEYDTLYMQKELRKHEKQPLVWRTAYAVHLLRDGDEQKAEQCRKQFLRRIRHTTMPRCYQWTIDRMAQEKAIYESRKAKEAQE